ncbi:MAG: type II toxin-antitoxin system HicA family toxin [Parcubacteria group bacterium]
MPSLKQLSGSRIIRVLEKMGYFIVRKKGSHIRLHHQDGSKKPITVPDHKKIGKGLLRKIIRDVQLSKKDFEKLLK